MNKKITKRISKVLIFSFVALILSLGGFQCWNDDDEDSDNMTQLMLINSLNPSSVYTISIPKGVATQ